MTDTRTVASAERQREIIDAIYLEGLNKGDLSIADQYLTPDFRNHGSHDDSLTGPEAFKFTIRKQRSGFSDIRYEILDFVSQGDKAVVRWVMHGRHTGEFLGVPPTGKTVQHHAILILRFEGEKIAERWGIVDNFALLRTLNGGPKGPGAGRPVATGAPVGGDALTGRWTGSVTYEGKQDDYTVQFNPDGSLELTTTESQGTGNWSMTENNSFRFSVKEYFKRDESGATPDKVLPGAAYVQIDFIVKRSGSTYSGSGTAQVRGTDGSVIHSTTAETVATRT